MIRYFTHVDRVDMKSKQRESSQRIATAAIIPPAQRENQAAMDSAPSSTLGGLPVEMLESIIFYLDILDIARLQQASRHLRIICSRPFVQELSHLSLTSQPFPSEERDVRIGDSNLMRVGENGIDIRHSGLNYHNTHDAESHCDQPALIALLYSISNHPVTRDQYSDLKLVGLDHCRHGPVDSFAGVHHLRFPRLTKLELSGAKVRCVEDVATLVRAHASTLQELVLCRITAHETVDLVWDWFDLLTYMRDHLALVQLETAIWQPQMYDLTKMLDYRHVYFSRGGKVVKWSKAQAEQVELLQNFLIEEASLKATGRDAVREGITAHLARMRGRARAARVRKFLGKVVRSR